MCVLRLVFLPSSHYVGSSVALRPEQASRHLPHAASGECRSFLGAALGEFSKAQSAFNSGVRRHLSNLLQNRDVMEVIFLFLDWLSTFAHITVKDGNKMELTSIAKSASTVRSYSVLHVLTKRYSRTINAVMAPTLLRPLHRPPHPHEVPSMISSVLLLLEDQHLLHLVPVELAQVLHIEVPKEHLGKKGAAESGGLVAWLEKVL